MKKLITPLLAMVLATIFSLSAKAQNLVPNPSFEQYDTCPDSVSQISRAIGWYAAIATPDYFNACSTDTNLTQHIVNVPLNWAGYRTPASGNAYAGIIAKQTEFGECLGIQLTTPLQTGIKYYLSFEVSLGAEANPFNRCGINKLGALFTTYPYLFVIGHNSPICNCAQIYSDSIVTDTLNWTRLKGSFIADSNYSYINIGNFFSDYMNDSIQVLGNDCLAYYYIDDVCLSNDSEYTYNYTYTGINTLAKEPPITIFPNPVTDFITVEDQEGTITEFRIFSMLGELVRTFIVSKDYVHTINLNELSKGIYNLTIYKKNVKPISHLVIKL